MKKFLSLIITIIIICLSTLPTFALYYNDTSKGISVFLDDDKGWTYLDQDELSDLGLYDDSYADTDLYYSFSAFYNEKSDIYIFFSYIDVYDYNNSKVTRNQFYSDNFSVEEFADFVNASKYGMIKKAYNGTTYFIDNSSSDYSICASTIQNGYLYIFSTPKNYNALLYNFLSTVQIDKTTEDKSTEDTTTKTYSSYSQLSTNNSLWNYVLFLFIVADLIAIGNYFLDKRSKRKTRKAEGYSDEDIKKMEQKDKHGNGTAILISVVIYFVVYFPLWLLTTTKNVIPIALAVAVCSFFVVRKILIKKNEKKEKSNNTENPQETPVYHQEIPFYMQQSNDKNNDKPAPPTENTDENNS